MIWILHGEDLAKSRVRLNQLRLEHQKKNCRICNLEADKIEPAELTQELEQTGLFNEDRLVILEKLHSLRSKKKKEALLEIISKTKTNLILYEERSLTKTMLKPFKQARVEEFKPNNQLFSWLDSLTPNSRQKANSIKLLEQALETNDEYGCLAMLGRQVRLLIQAKDGGKISGPPFVINKIKRQAQLFSLPRLLWAHSQLLEFDLQTKTSTNQLTAKQFLVWLCFEL